MASYFWGSSVFDEAVEKATSELLPSGTNDIALSLEICDQIRSKSVQPRDAMRAIKRRLDHKNPNVQLLALELTDVCIKNGGDHFLEQVASREFMDNLVSILKQPALNFEVRSKILRLIQNWALAFEQKPSLGYVPEAYKSLKTQGFNFPPPDATAKAKAILATRTAPEWIDSDVCLRCRTPFTFTNRKHHCRNCGQVFDQQCSSRTAALPHFGITQEVRVCDSCWTTLKMDKDRAQSPERSKHRSSHSRSDSHLRKELRRSQRAGGDTADDDLQRAIALSLAEAQANANGYTDRPGYVPAARSEPPLAEYADGEEDAELRAAIEASLREAQAPRASAPAPVEPVAETPRWTAPRLPQYDLDPREEDAILSFNQAVEQASAGGQIAPQAADMYERASVLRPKLVRSLDDTGRKEHMLSEMHDKLSQAVKLYDRLLTEQVERAAWRYQSSYAQQAQQYGPPQQYAQQPQQYGQPQSYGPPQQYGQQQTEPQYAAPQAPPQPPFAAPAAPQQYPSAPLAYPPAPASYPTAPTPTPHTPSAYPSAPPPNAYPSAPVPGQYAAPYSPPVPTSPGLQRHGSMTGQHGPVSIVNPQAARPTSMYAPPPPQTPQQVAVSSSYPPQPYQTVTPQPAAPQQYQPPARSQSYQTAAPPQPYQNVASPPPASALPNLPSVPPMLPSAPQGFPQSQYGGVEKTEQQEAMLISFD